MMRKACYITVVAMLLVSVVIGGNICLAMEDAENVSYQQEVVEAIATLEDWRSYFAELDISDEDSIKVCEQVWKQIMLYEQPMLIEANMSDDSNVVAEVGGVERTSGCEEVDDLCHIQTSWTELDKFGLMACTDVWYNAAYLRVRFEAYDESENYVGMQIVDIGKRQSGEVVVLFIDYDEGVGGTGRYAVWMKGEDEKCIYTKTYGLTSKVYLDVDSWRKGEDFGEWDKSLLYAR